MLHLFMQGWESFDIELIFSIYIVETNVWVLVSDNHKYLKVIHIC